jgi:S-adenosyl-L-methionine hydrolase (adenosine-forming)
MRDQRSGRLVAFLLAVVLAGCAARRPAPPVVFMTDFGVADDSVAICKGVMLGIAPSATIVDLTHDVKPFAVADAARYLAGATPYFPPGSVFVVVVDPGVGGTRRAMVALSKHGQYFVVPDNGVLTLVAERDGLVGAREITNPAWLLPSRASATFHGRDVFSPAGGHLARGEDWTAAGPPIAEPMRIPVSAAALGERGLEGTVIGIDGPFGNLITDAAPADLARLGYTVGDTVTVRLGRKTVRLPFVRTFSDVPEGAPLLYVDSRGRVAVAVNKGNFAAGYHVVVPTPFFVPRKRH